MSDTYFGFIEEGFQNEEGCHKEEDSIKFIESHPLCVSEKSQYDQCSPLYHATSFGGYTKKYNIVKALLKHNPEIDFKDPHGRTPLWIAARNGEEEIVKILLQSGASPSVECDTCRLSVLHIAVQKRHLEVVKLLIEKNTPIDPRDARGETPLFKAVRNNDLEMVKELVKGQASKSIKNKDDKTLEDLVLAAGEGVYVDPDVEAEITGKPRTISEDDEDEKEAEDDKDDKEVKDEEYDYDNDPYLSKFLDHIDDRKLASFFTKNGAVDLNESLRPYTIQAKTMIRKLQAEDQESASEVALLTLYDLAILIDDSTSMRFEDKGARIKILEKFIEAISYIYSLTRDGENGKIRRIRFLNSRKGSDHVDKASAKKLLYKHPYTGMTRIGTELERKILKDLVNAEMPRPLLVMVITDGEVQGEKKGVLGEILRYYIERAKANPGGQYSVSFQFCRIGEDPGAKKLLEDLDNDEYLGENIDCQRANVDLESMLNKTSSRTTKDPHFQEITKLLIGAISAHWDDIDKPQDPAA